MKKLIISFLVASVALIPSSAKADNLTADQTKAAAAYYLSRNTDQSHLTAADLTLVHQVDNPNQGVPALCFFNAPKEGWIIMAATTTLDPVVAFSPTNQLKVADFPANLQWWLDGYAQMVIQMQDLDAEQDLPDSEEWDLIANAKLPEAKNYMILMNESWGQGDEYHPTYNLYCPVIDGRTSVAGCVAIALAQICHYYRYPVQPTGTRVYSVENYGTIRLKFDTISFDYGLMPNALGSNSSEAQVREVAKLCYAMGVAVKMGYHPDGSGSNSQFAMSAMKNFFKYKEGHHVSRNGTGVDTAFVGKIRRELIKKNIVYMSGNSPDGGDIHAAGHAWVCGGYRTNNQKQYFMNWGWSGAGDGFFNLYDNNMRISGMGYNFYGNQSALIGFEPPADSNRFHVGISQVDNTVLAPAYPNPATVSVTLPYTLDAAADLCIYNIDGRLVETRHLAAGNGQAVVRVDHMPAGIYIYRVGGAAGKFIVK